MARAQLGIKNGRHIFTVAQIKKIRKLYGKSRGRNRPPTGMSTYDLAARYNTHPSTIGRIVRHETWKGVK